MLLFLITNMAAVTSHANKLELCGVQPTKRRRISGRRFSPSEDSVVNFRRERSDDRKYVCASQVMWSVIFYLFHHNFKSKNSSLSINDHFKSIDMKPPWLSVRFSPLYEDRYATHVLEVVKCLLHRGYKEKFWQIFSGCRSFLAVIFVFQEVVSFWSSKKI